MRAGAATIYGHVFENLRTGLGRDLFWNIFIDLQQGGDDVDGAIQSISCDWLTFAARRWSDLNGLSLSDCRQPNLVECSVYRDSEHQWARLESLSIRSGAGLGQSSLTLSLAASSATVGATSAVQLDVECELRFEGIVVVPANLTPSPTTTEEAAKIVAEFADLAALQSPIWDRFRYVFRPSVLAEA